MDTLSLRSQFWVRMIILLAWGAAVSGCASVPEWQEDLKVTRYDATVAYQRGDVTEEEYQQELNRIERMQDMMSESKKGSRKSLRKRNQEGAGATGDLGGLVQGTCSLRT